MERPSNLLTCIVCGQAHEASNTCIWMNLAGEGEDRITCKPCCVFIGRCHTCINGQTCEFETNPSPTPKVIMQTFQNGNMTMQQQVKNPERIKEFCHNCPCWLNGWCGKELVGETKCITDNWRLKE